MLPDPKRHGDLLRLIYEGFSPPSFSANEVRTYLDILSEDHESTLPLFYRLLSTGTDSGRSSVGKAVREALRGIHYHYQQSHLNLDWKDLCPEYFHPTLNDRITRCWNIENVLSEFGDDVNSEAVRREVERKFLHTDLGQWTAEERDENIRGYTALTIAGVSFVPDRTKRARAQLKAADKYHEDTQRFISWAGTHTDIRLVISTARERQTLDIDVLKPIVESPQSPAINQGIL